LSAAVALALPVVVPDVGKAELACDAAVEVAAALDSFD
jgi:hypothetical protein